MRRTLPPVRGALVALCMHPAGALLSAPRVVCVPADFPIVCAQDLTNGASLCPAGVTAEATRFCAAGLRRLPEQAIRFGVAGCEGASAPPSGAGPEATPSELVLLVDDRELKAALRDLTPVLGSSDGRSIVKATRGTFRNQAGSVVRDTIVIGEGAALADVNNLLQGDPPSGGNASPGPDQSRQSQVTSLAGCRAFGAEQLCRQAATDSGDAEDRMAKVFVQGLCLHADEGITCASAGIADLQIIGPEGQFFALDELTCEQRGSSVHYGAYGDGPGTERRRHHLH